MFTSDHMVPASPTAKRLTRELAEGEMLDGGCTPTVSSREDGEALLDAPVLWGSVKHALSGNITPHDDALHDTHHAQSHRRRCRPDPFTLPAWSRRQP